MSSGRKSTVKGLSHSIHTQPYLSTEKRMNVMRKWWGSGSRVGGVLEGLDPTSPPAAQQHLALGLMHLKKLFSEYSIPPHPLSEPEKEDKLYNMLPLFCKVFGASPSSDLQEKFGEVIMFTQHVSKLMVTEIRRRASNQSTEAASCAIVRFLEIDNCEESSNGWMLLSTLNLLAAGPPQLIEVMTAASLPSTLVKCLYLFFDLPEYESPATDVTPLQTDKESTDFSPSERRILLQKVFVQVLVKLCSHTAPAEELARKDDLTLLFSAITSWCPQHNALWRKSAAEVLMTLSRHGLSQPVVSYIHNKGCVGLCVENMERGQDLSPLEIVEMFVTVFCFLKDSSEVSQTLLDDFRSSQGYAFLTEFLLRLEADTSDESREALRNLVLLVSSLSYCGYVELKPTSASVGSLFHIPGFTLPVPSGRGASVRNVQAFNVLQLVFLRGTTPNLCSVILDAISAVYQSDAANYFILESQHTLSTFAEKIHAKPKEIQEKYFQLLEFVVFQLKFVPCKELISLSILLKAQHTLSCSITCMNTLLTILKHNAVFKDVFREVGLLEVLVTCLSRYHELLKSRSQQDTQVKGEGSEEEQLGFLVVEALTFLLSGNSQNAAVFRESGGAKCAIALVPFLECRLQALGVMQQLVLASGSDDDMGSLLGLLHSAPATELQLKIDILKSLLICLKESHRTRTVFRKVGGFLYVMSALVGLEGSLGDVVLPPWTTISSRLILTLLLNVFNTLTTAMRYEPANAKFFHQEICYTSFCDTLRLLGCFQAEAQLQQPGEEVLCLPAITGKAGEGILVSNALADDIDLNTFHTIFTTPILEYVPPAEVPVSLVRVVQILQLMYHMALDAFDKASPPSFSPPDVGLAGKDNKAMDISPSNKRPVAGLNLGPMPAEPVIVHAGVITSLLHLLPSIQHPAHPRLACLLQLYTAHLIKSLVRTERNQQLMCEVGLAGDLLSRCSQALVNERHPLHPPLQYIFERLAAQAIHPRDLRIFLRLGNPLNCRSLDEVDLGQGQATYNGPVPLTRIKTLVSMTTPRDFRVGTLVYPSFVEFDMSAEGFGCLFLPSIAPQSASGGSVVGSALSSTEPNVIGGIGTGDRIFPPQTGLTYSTWVCVEKYSDPRTDPHCVRMLTLVRHVPGRDHHLVCLSVVISARDKALIVSTHETNFPQPGQGVTEWEPDVVGDFGCRTWCPDLLTEGQWHHVTISLSRSVLKNSSLCIYIDGQLVTQKKLHYILQNPGGGAANLTIASSVYAYIGTPPAYRRHSKLVWKQGCCHLVEEVLQPQMVNQLFQLGPHYTGSLQAAQIPGVDSQIMQAISVVPEEKVIFGLNATAISHLTLNKIRKMYSKVDNKAIAKQLGMSSHENATPIRVVHNSAGHLSGPSRSLGGVVIGYLGVRVFCPRPVAAMLDNVGGCSVLLGLVAMSKDVESLYASVKALSCVIKTSKTAQVEMNQSLGYQTLALLLHRKKCLLNSHILHLCMSLAGSGEARESSAIPNTPAFNDLLCDLEVWCDAPGELCRTLMEHLLELSRESGERHHNVRKMRSLHLVQRLLRLLWEQSQGKEAISTSPSNNSSSVSNTFASLNSNNNHNPATSAALAASNNQPSLSSQTTSVIFTLLSTLLANNPHPQDLLSFGQFIVSTLPIVSISEKHIELKTSGEENGDTSCQSVRNILLRNKCLEIIHSLLYNSNKNTIHLGFCEEVVKVLGLDWVLLFAQGHLHPSTVLIALRMLVALLSNASILQKFRDATQNGGWMTDAHQVTSNKSGQFLGYSVGSVVRSLSEIREEAWHVPGFQVLTWLVPHHIHIPQVYYLLLALLLGQPVKNVQNNTKLDLDTIWTFVFGVPASQCATTISGRVSLCPEAAIAILTMVRAMLNQEDKGRWRTRSRGSVKDLPEWLQSYPVTLIQFLRFLYQQNGDFLPVFLSGDVLGALASSLFPYTTSSEPQSLTSPDDDKFQGGRDMVVRGESDGTLTNHPAKQQVVDFLKNLVVDSLSLPPASKTPHTIDLLLEATPENSSEAQVCEFQTQLLGTLMEHLLDADILIGEGAALPVVAGGSIQHIAPNVFYLAARIVDKLWAGMFNKDPHEVFDFIIKLISQAKRRASGINLESIYHCLNRTILYLLSRPTDSIAAQMSILEALHKLTTHRTVVFGAGNHEPEFVACLTYCLLQLTADLKINTEVTSRSTWHVNPVVEGTGVGAEPWDSRPDGGAGKEGSVRDFAEATATQSHNLMITAATRVWEELYITKKPAIEEVYKVSLSAGSGKAPELASVRDLVNEASQRLWLAFLEGEKKQYSRLSWEIPTQIQSVTNKLQKVTGGLTRLASRTKGRREDSIVTRKVTMPMADVQMATFTHISIIGDLIDLQYRQHLQKTKHMTSYVWESWQRCERELTRERGLWGPMKGSHLDKWILDATEGPCRMRKKMVHNRLFYKHYPYKQHIENPECRQLKYKVATSFDSKEHAEKRRPEGLSDADMWEKEPVIEEETTTLDATDSFAGREVGDIDMKGLQGAIVKTGGRPASDIEDDNDSLDIGEMVGQDTSAPTDDSQNPDNQTLLRLLDYGEKISHMFRCARIQGLDTIEGLLLFGREHFYIVDGFTLLKSREIRDIASLPEGSHEPIVPSTSPLAGQEQHACSKFHYDEIREVHQRRYLLQPIALEIFSSDGRNYLLALPRKLRNKTYQRLLMVCTGLADNAQQSVEGQRRSASVEQAGGLFSSIIGETSVTHRWVRGEISNFQYLMHLNTLAGRSYNDLMQYPIFPWVLADYTSEELDLTSAATFRDLSKPMGAQTPDRLEQFAKRYREWDDPSGETPPYHYGTHYSSAMIVSSYLVRMEPFTQHFLRLQGGHFDLADRMFHSMKEAWHSASRNNMADVKELIPEFFYLPEFFVNSNKFDLGCKQSGKQLDDVVLPPWAKGDAREFIRLHRMALECDYVSAHLHEWIDLIFGYKQLGQPAVEAVNVFHHLFYEGNVDIYNIDDPLKKNATIGFINNFGQIPKQLFRKPHPCKKLSGQRTSIIDAGPLSQAPTVTPIEKVFYQNLDNLRPSMHAIKEVKGAVGQIIAQDKLVLAVEQNKTLIPPTYQRFLAWGFADQSLRIGGYESERAVLVSETPQNGEILAAVCPNNKTIITAGTSTVINVYEVIKRQLVQKKSLYGHSDGITCLAACSAYGLLVSGSRDRSAIIWDLARLAYVRQLAPHQAPVAAVSINEQTGDIATCAGTWLHVWSINGAPVATVNTALGAHSPQQQILCVSFSTMYEWDPSNVIMTGSSDGVVRMWGIEYVQVPTNESPAHTATADTAAEADSTALYKKDNTAGGGGQGTKGLRSPSGPSPTHSLQPGRLSRAHDVVRRLSTVEDFPQALLSKSVSESSLSEEGESDLEDNEKHEDTEEDTSTVDLASYTVISSQAKVLAGQEEEEAAAGQETLSKTEKEKRPLHRQVAMSVSSASTHSMDSQTKSLEAQDDIVLRRSSHYPQGVSRAISTIERVASHTHDHRLQTSKSETSLADSDTFVLISDSEVQEAQKQQVKPQDAKKKIPKNPLMPGMKWVCQLVFRSKLTMHTAYDRRDNTEPASVTALTISKDHRTVLVGDARGRVFSWSVPDQPGRAVADHWVRDDGSDTCANCQVKFSIYERRHHCRNCGHLFCSKCSRFESEISRLRILKPVRVCQKCYTTLRHDK
ncbi:WD repeat and FYVE domain-containing protein 3-like isoform X2 [Eriocheir sinensis]|uniref:WD repeat and FYVE domain-containing protein 3-like isoform X2 n=1 Tax=Eriocheir sinensis TaxID=95602 RepID=UPI0021C641C1|nr:WD repeat and FYVE domain-containing protein 3-like isoform X2 [Eriocheir sinensis]